MPGERCRGQTCTNVFRPSCLSVVPVIEVVASPQPKITTMTERNVPLAQLAEAAIGRRHRRAGGLCCFVDLAYDSRRVTPGSLFVAVVGESFDGHHVCRGCGHGRERLPSFLSMPAKNEFAYLTVPRLLVGSTRGALPYLACEFYGNPTQSLYLAGVTGTNGKDDDGADDRRGRPRGGRPDGRDRDARRDDRRARPARRPDDAGVPRLAGAVRRNGRRRAFSRRRSRWRRMPSRWGGPRAARSMSASSRT